MASTATDIANRSLIKIGANTVTAITGTEKRAVTCNTLYADLRDELTASHPWKFALKRVRLTAAGILDCSAKTIAFNDAGPDTITDSGSGFVTAGWVAGDRVAVTGSASNNGSWDVDTVAAGTLTLNKNEEVTAESLVNDTDLKLYLQPNHKYDYKYAKPSGCLKVVSVNEYGPSTDKPFWEEEGSYIITSELDSRDQIDVLYIAQITDVTAMPSEYVNALVAKLAAEIEFDLTGKANFRAALVQESEFYIEQAYRYNLMRDNQDRSRRQTSWQKSGR